MLEIRQIKSTDKYDLMSFFKKMKNNKYFHPHSFEEEYAKFICNYYGNDIYYITLIKNKIISYSFLRGLDDGYSIPGLGIFIDENFRGKGISKLIMNFLHMAAKLNGSSEVRLKVHKQNKPAIKLYESMGYNLINFDKDQFVGYIKV